MRPTSNNAKRLFHGDRPVRSTGTSLWRRFGASNLESEANLAHLDRTLAGLLSHVDRKVGLANTLIVLSADHGQPEAPGYLHGQGMENAHYFDTAALDKAPAIAAVKARFGIGEELIEAFFQPYLYLDHDLIRERGLDQAEVEQAIAVEQPFGVV